MDLHKYKIDIKVDLTSNYYTSPILQITTDYFLFITLTYSNLTPLYGKSALT